MQPSVCTAELYKPRWIRFLTLRWELRNWGLSQLRGVRRLGSDGYCNPNTWSHGMVSMAWDLYYWFYYIIFYLLLLSWFSQSFRSHSHFFTFGIQPISAQATTIFNVSLNMAADIILSIPKISATCIELIEMQHRNDIIRTFKSTRHRLHPPMSHLALTNHRMRLLC